jgi:hypothetical protein
MFDLKYYKGLKQKNYIQEPIVNLLFVYEDLFLNIDKSEEEKLTEIKERNQVLYTLMKHEKLPEYPCLFSEHHKVRNKLDKILAINNYIYMFIVINNKVEMRTKSTVSEDIKKIIYNKVVSQIFGQNLNIV